MKFKEWINKYRYLGQCDKLRKCGDETNWQTMMSQKRPISQEQFESMCELSELLEDEETVNDFIAADPGSGFYTSIWGDTPCCFMQTHGFEFIFAPPQ